MKTEYLVTFDSSDNQCTNIETLKSLLKSNELITLPSQSKIKFKEFEYGMVIGSGKLSDNSRYFDVTFECADDSKVEDFREFLKEIRKIFYKACGRDVLALYDGIGGYYCNLSYPKIYDIENLMRKLITKFMAISIGPSWAENSVPRDVTESIKDQESKKIRSNILFEVDFIQLSNFLFKKYTKNDSSRFFEGIKTKDDKEQISIMDLKEFVPYSNWERYFFKRVNCESDYIKIKWERLYDIRCKVAHCKSLTLVEFTELEKLCDEVKEKLNSALLSIADINIDDNDKEELAENMVGAANVQVYDFINAWKELCKLIYLISVISSHPNNTETIRKSEHKTRFHIHCLSGKGVISKEMKDDILQVQKYRNSLIHQIDFKAEKEIMDHMMSKIKSIYKELLSRDPDEYDKFVSINMENGTKIEFEGSPESD